MLIALRGLRSLFFSGGGEGELSRESIFQIERDLHFLRNNEIKSNYYVSKK